ncbi:MAG: NTP transferase domain-containing protein [Chloracidobacterium sp.]|nr:NTP transferase domain-containing protein [Chloracidobacterium sp.]
MIDNSELKIGAMLLAAGGSSRLGQPKQLLRFHGTTLLRHTAEMLTKTSCWSIVVVLGADFEAANAELAGLEIHTAINENWQTGNEFVDKVWTDKFDKYRAGIGRRRHRALRSTIRHRRTHRPARPRLYSPPLADHRREIRSNCRRPRPFRPRTVWRTAAT